MEDPKTRFSDRAENYAAHRPEYPKEVLEFIAERCGLTGSSVVADIGSGTGLMSALFLGNGNGVLAVEPNREMRGAAEGILGDHPRFRSVAGSAEDTTLADDSVDLVVAANALHWIDRDRARVEFSRILKPGGHASIVWSIPRRSGSPFSEALGELFSAHRTDGGAGGDADAVYAMTEVFFGGGTGDPQNYEVERFPHSLRLDFEGLKGLMLSPSSMPAESRPGFDEMLRDLESIFRANEAGGEIVVEYLASVYCGRLV